MNKASLGWPMVALIGILASAFVGIFALIPDGEPGTRTMLVTAITTASSAIVMWFVKRTKDEVVQRVSKVEELVNGNMSRVIDKIPDGRSRAVEALRHEERTGNGGT